MKSFWRKHGIRNFLLIVVGGIVVSGILFFVLSLFKIRHIEVEPSTISVVTDSSQFPSNLLFFPSEKLRTFLLKEYPRIKDVTFTKQFPGTLKINVVIRTPLAFVFSNSRMLAMDDAGVLFEFPGKKDLPILELPIEEMSPGKQVKGKGVDTSLAFLTKISHDEKVERIIMSTDSTLEARFNDMTVLFLADGNGESTADTLQALLKGFRMKGSVPHIIDLRFSKPIITP